MGGYRHDDEAMMPDPPITVEGVPHYFAARDLDDRVAIRAWASMYAVETDLHNARQMQHMILDAILPTVPGSVLMDINPLDGAALIVSYLKGPGEVIL